MLDDVMPTMARVRLIGFVLTLRSMRIFDRHIFDEDRHTCQKCGQKPERVVQADSLGQRPIIAGPVSMPRNRPW
jgi:hypothetical protein